MDNLVFEQPEQCSNASMFGAMADGSMSRGMNNTSTSEAVDISCAPQSPVDCSDSSNADNSDRNSEQEIISDADAYTLEELHADLQGSQWRERWAWSRNVNEIVFVHFTLTLKPRLHCSVKTDPTLTVSTLSE